MYKYTPLPSHNIFTGLSVKSTFKACILICATVPLMLVSQSLGYSILLSGTPSRQSTRLFLQSSQLGPPPPHTRLRERGCGIVPIRTKGQTQWYSRYICTLWSLAPSYRFDVVPKESAGLFVAAAWVSLTEQKRET